MRMRKPGRLTVVSFLTPLEREFRNTYSCEAGEREREKKIERKRGEREREGLFLAWRRGFQNRWIIDRWSFCISHHSRSSRSLSHFRSESTAISSPFLLSTFAEWVHLLNLNYFHVVIEFPDAVLLETSLRNPARMWFRLVDLVDFVNQRKFLAFFWRSDWNAIGSFNLRLDRYKMLGFRWIPDVWYGILLVIDIEIGKVIIQNNKFNRGL